MTLAQKILRWYRTNGRDLPWRKTRDPYKILVSEIMLQQTQVQRGLLFYEKWLRRFPDWNALANASNAEVIRAWAGLGYNRRALMLRDLALAVVKHGVPKTEQDWLTLKGIGPYTAAAVACFSLHEKTIPIDTNIRRVLGRLFFGIPYPQPAADDRIRKMARTTLLDTTKKFYDVPQALFDLATAICLKEPVCNTCPWKDDCKSAPKFLSGRVRVPKAMIKKTKETHHNDKPYPDRIYRGRILALVREKGVCRLSAVGPAIDPEFTENKDQTWLKNMIKRMEKDGMIRQKNNGLTLPD